ncbi:MAG TPA: beta-ketoacyl synthase N-terminal-like domain-containing protein [Polyangiaceae bacterium]|nr:beta-ketoacyl synthase N-terminal-like domain-containing protein [Polyangiaceae bacterium]
MTQSPSSHRGGKPARIGIFGWGVVAPGAKDMAAFRALLERGETALRPSPRAELGYGLFAVGDPDFRFEEYAPWVASRHGEGYVARMRSKMGENVLFSVGAMVQALGCDERLEGLLRELDGRCHIYVGSGVGDLPESYRAATDLARALRVWNHFWAEPARCEARRRYAAEGVAPGGAEAPPDPAALPVDSDERWQALGAWDAFWASHSDALAAFTARYAEIERLDFDEAEGPGGAPTSAIHKRQRAHRKLIDEVGCPKPPWAAVDSDLIWNIQNVPSSQLSMLLGVHGPAWATVGACSAFGVSLKCGIDAIRRGEASAVIVGTTDPRPDPALVGAFHQARVMPGTGEVNFPLTSLRGTHVSGGACLWIIGDADYFEARGLRPVGGYVAAATVSSDAEHIITPSKTGPKRAIDHAFAEAGIGPGDVAIADLHATGTPGDINELALLESYLGPQTLVTARKGVFGHGMANCGGWELTALALSLREGFAFPTGIPEGALNRRVREARGDTVVTSGRPVRRGYGIKTMLGIGGITACVILKAADGEPEPA